MIYVYIYIYYVKHDVYIHDYYTSYIHTIIIPAYIYIYMYKYPHGSPPNYKFGLAGLTAVRALNVGQWFVVHQRSLPPSNQL